MIPLRDTERSRSRPVITPLIIVVNILVFLYMVSLGSRVESFIFDYGLVPRRYFMLASQGPEAWLNRFGPVLTSMFAHGGWLHIIFNMLFLWIFGDNVEDRLGRLRFLAFYIICGAGAAYLQLYLGRDSDVPMVGASGAIAGVMGGYLLLFPRARVLTLVPVFLFIQFIEIPAYFFIGFWFLMQFLTGTLTLGNRADTGGVAYWAHVGGFAAGLLLVKPFSKRTVR